MARQAALHFPIAPKLTCRYEFAVEPGKTGEGCWTGAGLGGAFAGNSGGLVGREPGFEFSEGWLKLLPTAGSGLQAFAVYLGAALDGVIRGGDTLQFSRDLAADVSYRLERKGEALLRAGSVDEADAGGEVAAWQEWELRPNTLFDKMTREFPGRRFPESFRVTCRHVNVRILGRSFQLGAGEEAAVEPHYVFVARLHEHGGVGMVDSRAIHAYGRLGELTGERIAEAARALAVPATRML